MAKRKRPAKLRRPAKLWCDALVTMQWEKFEAGDNEALFDAFAYCFISGARPPVSLANEFYARYAKWRSFQVRTLDEAFGVVRERTHVEQAAASERLKLAVVFMVEYLRREARKQNKKLSVNAALVSAADMLRTSEGKARSVYFASDNQWRKLMPTFQTLSLRKPENS